MKTYRCPTCGEIFTGRPASFPFCSDRCKMIDLGNWVTEKYVVKRPLTPEEWALLDEEVEKNRQH